MYVHPYFSLDERRLEVRVGDFVALQEGVEVVVCGVKKKKKENKLHCPFCALKEPRWGHIMMFRKGLKKKVSETVVSRPSL